MRTRPAFSGGFQLLAASPASSADASVALWLDALGEPVRTIERYGLAARRVGRVQGTFARALPREPWLSRRWLRAYLDLRVEMTGPRSEEQEAALRTLEGGPQTLCHLDFYPGNLFGDGEETILIDWAYCGIGALGEDPGNFVPDALLDGFVPAAQAAELERAVWDGYRAGLADAGGPETNAPSASPSLRRRGSSSSG